MHLLVLPSIVMPSVIRCLIYTYRYHDFAPCKESTSLTSFTTRFRPLQGIHLPDFLTTFKESTFPYTTTILPDGDHNYASTILAKCPSTTTNTSRVGRRGAPTKNSNASSPAPHWNWWRCPHACFFAHCCWSPHAFRSRLVPPRMFLEIVDHRVPRDVGLGRNRDVVAGCLVLTTTRTSRERRLHALAIDQ